MKTWERCESGRIGTPGERVFTMWTVGSNPTLSVEIRETGPGTKGAADVSGQAWTCYHARTFCPGPARSFHNSFGAVAQLGERQNRNLEVGGSIPLCSTRKAGRQAVGVFAILYYRLGSITVVLDGELAVPCNPQPATAGSNSHPEDRTCVVGMRCIRY